MNGFVKRTELVANEIRAALALVDPEAISALVEVLTSARFVVVIGVGREGLAARAFTMRMMHAGIDAHWIWDDTAPPVGPGDVLLAISGSGAIGHIDYVARKSQENGALLAVVTGDVTGCTARRADQLLLLPAAAFGATGDVVRSIQPMGSLFEQVAFITFDLIVLELVDRSGAGLDSLAHRHRNLE